MSRYMRRAVLGALLLLFALPALGDEASAPASSFDVTPQEQKLGERGVIEVERVWRVVNDPALRSRAETIVGRIAPYMSRRMDYEVKILDTDMINAFSLPNGRMYVCVGMMDFVRTDLELAGVIAHEMAHADKGHVIIQSARNERMTLLALAAAIASRGEAAALILANVVQIAVMGAYSIDLEKEADAVGIDALMMAGYNPVGMLTLQERLQEEAMRRPERDPGVARTHPKTRERVAAAVKYMKDNDVKINRKLAIRALRTTVETSGDVLALIVGGETVWRGRDDEATRELFGAAADALTRRLRMETAPYDIRVEIDSQGESFFIEGERIVRSRDLPPGTESLHALREGVMRAQNAARRSHPMASYDM